LWQARQVMGARQMAGSKGHLCACVSTHVLAQLHTDTDGSNGAATGRKKVRNACDRLGRCLGHAYIQTCTASMEQQQGENCEEWRQLGTCLG
jgi:hypothetical protein